MGHTSKPQPLLKDFFSCLQRGATFVQNYTTFWVNVKSLILSYSGVFPNITPTSIGKTASTSSGSLTPSMLSITSAGCEVTKVCFSKPLHCNPAVDRGCYFMSASVSPPPSGSSPPSGSVAQFEMKGPSPGYVSFGFSDDRQMGNDDIYICALETNGFVQVQHAFSTGKRKPNTLPLGNVSNVMGSLQDGVISCSFTSMNPISTQQRFTDFNTPYYLLYAYGPTSNVGDIRFHIGDFSSSDKVDITNPQLVSGAGKPQSVKAHGALMLIAWMTMATLGMMVARYLKSLAKGHSPFGKAVWFLAHVSLMSLTVLATSIAFIVIFSYVGGWSGGAHPVLGCLVMILAFIQPLATLFRCGPDHRLYVDHLLLFVAMGCYAGFYWLIAMGTRKSDVKRYVFNWLHMLNAVVIKALAVAAIFTGLQLFDNTEDQVLVKVMGGFVGWEAAFYLSFELYTSCINKGKPLLHLLCMLIPGTCVCVHACMCVHRRIMRQWASGHSTSQPLSLQDCMYSVTANMIITQTDT
ncbi:putative ferric-chelate reductase 1 [Merluccius polli]|uniref:Ferric-chelate reductase 1 n=1 Tax=Merluccius polli TaxID=89951 RepID=A0AA47LZ85_MERPO|nr:putative ferric-chelate reductase 1 [Merluccius polli]